MHKKKKLKGINRKEEDPSEELQGSQLLLFVLDFKFEQHSSENLTLLLLFSLGGCSQIVWLFLKV